MCRRVASSRGSPVQHAFLITSTSHIIPLLTDSLRIGCDLRSYGLSFSITQAIRNFWQAGNVVPPRLSWRQELYGLWSYQHLNIKAQSL